MMIAAFQEGAVSSGHQVTVVDVCRKKINGGLAELNDFGLSLR